MTLQLSQVLPNFALRTGPKAESGSATAELAITMPAVIAILIFALSSLSLQLQRIELSTRAATLARAVARAEPSSVIDELTRNGDRLRQNSIGKFSCVNLLRPVGVFGFAIEIQADACARTGGL